MEFHINDVFQGNPLDIISDFTFIKYFQDIMNGRSAKIPVYDFKTNARAPGEFTMIYPSDVVIVEGILVFYFPGIRDKFNLKLFVDTDADTRLARYYGRIKEHLSARP